ncbi:MAG: ATP-binding cassette domain-containing protein [Acetobacteraceae bacterium]|nr:ATP-binding cassette domain-containing protein [Acetobacteraceae bacterium]
MTVEVQGLVRRFGAMAALDGVSLALEPGEFAAVLGPSGSGKTTLLRVLAGLDFPDEGRVLLAGQDVAAVPARERGVGVVFQHYALFRHMTVFENVAFGLRVRPRRHRPAEAEIQRRVTALLELVQLPELAARFPDQLSGGQRQRVALARALAIEPRLLLLDEPFGALDALVRKEVRRWVRGLHDRLGLTSVLVTHDQEEAMEMADRVAVMDRGRVVQFATASELLAEPETPFVAGFLGEAGRLVGEVRAGLLLVEDVGFTGSVPLPDGPAEVIVRPGDVRVLAPADFGDLSPIAIGKVRSLRPVCDGAWRVVVAMGDRVIEGMAAGSPLPRGADCVLEVTRLVVFGANASGRAIWTANDPGHRSLGAGHQGFFAVD